MFKKELREIWKPVILRLIVVLAIPVVMTVMMARTSPEHMPNLIRDSFPIALIWVANFLGVTAFKAEFEDRSLEYWLTFPQGAGERFARKAAPRFALVLSMVLFYGVLCAISGSLVSDPRAFKIVGPCSVFFFINGCLCGFLSDRNLRMVANVVTFFSFGILTFGFSRILLPLFPKINQTVSPAVVSFSAFLIVAGIMGGIFLSSARKFDLRAPQLFLKRVRAFGLPLLLALDIAALVFHFAGHRT